LVFASSFFSIPLSGAGAASFAGSGGAAGSGAGAAGAGGGGGGAGSSFLPHPINVRVKAKRVIADNETSFFPILDSPPFPSHILYYTVLIKQFLSHMSNGDSSGTARKTLMYLYQQARYERIEYRAIRRNNAAAAARQIFSSDRVRIVDKENIRWANHLCNQWQIFHVVEH